MKLKFKEYLLIKLCTFLLRFTKMWSLVFFFSVLFLLIVMFLKKITRASKIPNLKGKHVLVTGGSSGIGKATALEAAKLGAHVTVVARDQGKLEKALDEIIRVAKSPEIQKIQFISLDVTGKYDAVVEALNSVENSVGPIFLLINCAGMAICNELEDITENDMRYMMDLNFFGTVFPTLAIGKKMKKRKEGHIVITGSQASLLGIFGMSAYCSSKFALRGFAESLHMELKPYNVSVTMCLPPDTNTPGFEMEEKSKPEVTRLISETAGLFEPEIVAKQLISDAIRKKFFSVVGFEGFILTTLCAGMSPISSFYDGFLQISLMSLLRLVSIGYLLHFQKIILKNIRMTSEKINNLQKIK